MYAIKIVRFQTQDDFDVISNEADIMRSVHHRHIVSYAELLVGHNVAGLVMLCADGDLDKLIQHHLLAK